MSLKSQIETAKDAVSKALITALENKDESAVTELMTCYSNLNSIEIKETFKINISKESYYDNFELYNMSYAPCSDDVISFDGITSFG